MFIIPESSDYHVLCLECRHFNLPEAENCEKCGKPLLKIPEKPLKMEKPLREIQEKTYEFDQGKINSSQYWDYLVKEQAFFEEQLKNVKNLELPPDCASEFEEEISIGVAGIKHYIEGIKILQEYCEKRKKEVADKGFSLLKSGSELINRAIAMNWSNFASIRKSTEEFLAQYFRENI